MSFWETRFSSEQEQAPRWEGSNREAYEIIYKRVRNDPFALCGLLNWTPTPQQAEVLAAARDGHEQIAVRSGQGIGKTAVADVLGLWRALRAEGALVVVTAPSMRQVQDVYMMEMRRIVQKAHPVLKDIVSFTARKVFIGRRGLDEDSDKEHWGILAVTATDPVNAQGYHQDQLTFIVDEASGVERPFIEQIQGTMSQKGGDRLLLLQGNPNHVDSVHYDAFHRYRAEWSCHVFNAEESPMVSPEHCKKLERQWGRDSNAYRVRVLGQFPNKDPNAVMSIEDLEACTKNDQLWAVKRKLGFKQFGLDFARFGDDESVKARVSGNALMDLSFYAKQEPSVVVKEAFQDQKRMDWKDRDCFYVADADGMGQGVMEILHNAGKNFLEFHTNGTPKDGGTYANRMTEAWFELAEKVRAREVYLPNDPELLEQLGNRLYSVRRTDGTLILESKDDYKKRTLRGSPDRADAVVMAFYDVGKQFSL